MCLLPVVSSLYILHPAVILYTFPPLSSQVLTHRDTRLPAFYPPPPPSLCDFPLSILFCCHPCGFHIHVHFPFHVYS